MKKKSKVKKNKKSKWETVVDFTKIKKGGVPVDEALKYLERI